MRVIEAKNQVLPLLVSDAKFLGLESYLDLQSPDGDDGKIQIAGEPARIIHPRDGFYAKINLDWFKGSTEMPKVNKGHFFWYVFALTEGRKGITSYFICDYTLLRTWVLEFDAPSKEAHKVHSYWRGEIHVLDDEKKRGYFRWGDESTGENKETRYINLKNIGQVIDPIIYSNTALRETDPLYQLSPQFDPNDPLGEIRKFRKTYQNLSNTEREAVIQSRIGQGRFRDDLIMYWQVCAVTGCNDLTFLRASHIKPWRIANNYERLDVFNGLLLIPNLDIAFDKGFITFDDDGNIIVSSKLNPQTCEIMGIKSSTKLTKIDKLHIPYLRFHKENIFKA